MNLAKSLGSIGGLTLVSRILALVRDSLQARFVGAGFASDAFLVAFRLPNMFRALFAEGAFSASFIPIFNRRVAEGNKAEDGSGLSVGLTFAEQALSVLLPILFLFTLVLILAAWPVTWALSGGFKDPTAEQFDYAVTLSRITLPYLFLISLVSLLGGILNSIGRFWVNAAAPILLNIAMVGGLLMFHGDAYQTARVQAIAVPVGGLLQLLWLMLACRSAGVKLRIRRPTMSKDVRQLLRLIVPAAVGAGAVQINLIVSTALSGALLDPGAISYIYYADRLTQLPLGLIGIGLGTILVPVISRLINSGLHEEAMETQNRGVELALFLTLPATVAFIVAAEPIIAGLFQHGEFTADDSLRCGWALSAFSIGLPSYVLLKVLTAGFYAREDTKTPVRYATVSVGVNFVGNLALIPLIGHVGPPLATAIASIVNIWMLYRVLRQRGDFEPDAKLRRRLPRLMLAAVVMGAALFGIDWLLAPLLAGAWTGRIIGLAILVTGGVAVYAMACFATGAFRLSDIKALVRRRAPKES